MKTLKYSIVIPHYNIPQLLQRCLESIPMRKDFQVIVVDNKSTPENRIAARTVCEKFSQVEYVQDEIGHGAGHARNIGLEYVKGEWLIFADADDFFYSSFWQDLDNYIEATSADILYFRSTCVDSDKLEPADRGMEKWDKLINSFICKGKNAEEELRLLHIGPVSKIFRSEFVYKEHIRFDETKTANDVMFSVLSGSKAKTIEAYDDIMYVVTKRNGSLTSRKDRDSLRCRYEVRLKRNRYLKTIGKTRYASSFPSYFVKALKNGGINELLWYIKKMMDYRVNPFWGYKRILRDKICSVL